MSITDLESNVYYVDRVAHLPYTGNTYCRIMYRDGTSEEFAWWPAAWDQNHIGAEREAIQRALHHATAHDGAVEILRRPERHDW